MPDELDQLYTGLSAHADEALLTEAAAVRTEGSRRRRLRTGLTLGAVALLVVAGVSVGAIAVADQRRAPAAQPGPSVIAGSAVGTVGSAGAPVPAASGSPVGSASVAPCTPADLATPPTIFSDGAAGHLGSQWTISSHSTRDCTLHGRPELWGSTGGAPVLLPQSPLSPATDTVLLRAGGAVSLATETINRYGGYPTDAPQCSHPATYQDVLIDLGGGGGRYHTGLAINITCADVRVSGWTTVQPMACTASSFVHPPVVSTVPGQLGYRVTLTAGPDTGCQLAKPPTLHAVDGTGAPVTDVGAAGPPVAVPRTGTVSFLVSVPAGTGSCGSPVSLAQLRLDSGDLHLDIPGTLDFLCAGATVSGWSTG